MTFKTANVFHVGPQKTGTTWVYRCFREHPEVTSPPEDKTHYFSMYYHKGKDWYIHCFERPTKKIVFDPTPNYFRSPVAAERIFKENPSAKIIMCFRQPIERAFSHYWHEKKKMRFNFDFEEVLENYDLYSNWIEPSFYFLHLKRYLQFFPKEQILVQFFDDLQKNPELFFQTILQFIAIDDRFRPSVLHERINAATPQRNPFYIKNKNNIYNILKKIGIYKQIKAIKNTIFKRRTTKIYNEKQENLHQVNPYVIKELNDIFASDISNLETLLNVDLIHWRNKSFKNGE